MTAVNSIYLYIAVAETNKWMSLCGWKDQNDGYVCVANQEDSIKTKNITEKITFDGKYVSWWVSMFYCIQNYYWIVSFAVS